MHGSVSFRHAPIKSKRKHKSGLQFRPVEDMSKPFVEEVADYEEHVVERRERFLVNLNECALHSRLASACQALMSVSSAHRPVTRAALETFIKKQTQTCKAFVVDPVDVVQLLLSHDVFHSSGKDQIDSRATWDVTAKKYADALKLLLSSCRPCLEARLPVSQWSRAQVTVKRARAVELHKMSLRAAARWILSQAFVCIDVPAADVVNTLCDVGALQLGDGQSGNLTYCNLHAQVGSRTNLFFDMPTLPDDTHFENTKVGLMPKVKLTDNQRKQGAKTHHKFQRLAYLKKTFGKGIRGETFGKLRRRRKKGVRKVLEVFSSLHSQEPKNASAKKNDMRLASAASARRSREKVKWNDRVLRSVARDDKYNTFVDSPDDCAWARPLQDRDQKNLQSWSSEWLAKWAVEEDLEHWYKQFSARGRRRCIIYS